MLTKKYNEMKQTFFALLTLIFGLSSCTNSTPVTTSNDVLTGSELKIVAEIHLKPEAFESIKPAFEKLIAGSQAEEGCIYYDLHADVTDTTNTRFMMIETWKDQEAIDFHNESDHYKIFQKVAKDYVDTTIVTVLKVAK